VLSAFSFFVWDLQSAKKSTPIKVEAPDNSVLINSRCKLILSTNLLKLRSRTIVAGGSSYGVGAPNRRWSLSITFYGANDHVTVAEDMVTLTGGGAQDVVNAALSSVAKDVVKRLREKPGS
jgi:hypothetical protein